MIVRELLTRLGFETDTQAVEDFESAIGGLTKTLGLAVAGATALTAGLFALTKNAQSAGDEIGKTARFIGIGADELQSLRFVADQAGVGVDVLTDALRTFNTLLGQVGTQASGPAADTLARLGISATDSSGSIRSLSDLLPDLSDAFQGIESSSEKAAIAAQLFGEGGSRILLLLSGGSKELVEATRRYEQFGAALSEEGVKNAEAMGDALSDLTTIAGGLRFVIFEELAPSVINLARQMAEWFVASKDIIQQNLRGWIQNVISVLGVFWALIGQVIKSINNVVQSLGGWESVLRLLAIQLGVIIGLQFVTWIKKIAPIITTLIGATSGWLALLAKLGPLLAITAAALLIEDIVSWANGNESAIGRVLGDWQDFRDKLAVIVDGITGRYNQIVTAASALKQNLSDLLPDFSGAFEETADAIKTEAGPIGDLFVPDFDQFKKSLRMAFGDAIQSIRSGSDFAIPLLLDTSNLSKSAREAQTNFEKLRATVVPVIAALAAEASAWFNALKNNAKQSVNDLITFITNWFDALPDRIQVGLDQVIQNFVDLASRAKLIFFDLVSEIGAMFANIPGIVGGAVSSAFGAIKDKAAGLLGLGPDDDDDKGQDRLAREEQLRTVLADKSLFLPKQSQSQEPKADKSLFLPKQSQSKEPQADGNQAIAPPAPSPAASFFPRSQTISAQAANTSSQITNTANVNTTVTLQVPPGTPQSQADFVKNSAGPEIQRAVSDAIQAAQQNYVVAE